MGDQNAKKTKITKRNTAYYLFTASGLKAESKKCIDCMVCTKQCPMSLNVNAMVKENKMENSECILCATCIDGCKKSVIKFTFNKGI